MKSQKLTHTMRALITNRALEHRFAEAEAALVERRFNLADKIYEKIYPAKVRELMAQLPDGFLESDKCLYYAIRVKDANFPIYDDIMLREARPMAQNVRRYEPSMLDSESTIAKQLHQLNRDRGALHDEKHKARLEITGALSSFTTVKALLDAWPEVEPFLPPVVAMDRTLPVVPVEQLNKTFKLPVKKSKAKKVANEDNYEVAA